MTLSCEAFGVPAANITWTGPAGDIRDDNRVSVSMDSSEARTTTSTLTITGVMVTDTGDYTCTVENGVPNEIQVIQQASATVTVQSESMSFACCTVSVIFSPLRNWCTYLQLYQQSLRLRLTKR